jgi:hypothetical protein
MTAAGRPKIADPGALYALAHRFYWDFRGIAEGTPRWRVNKTKQEQLEAELDNKTDAQLQAEMRQKRERDVQYEIREGLLKEEQREDRLRELENAYIPVVRDWLRRCIADDAREEFRFPGEPEVIDTLLDPNVSPEGIRAVCTESVMNRRMEIEPGVMKEIQVSAWPIATGSMLPLYLSQYADQYVEAIRDPRFPRCDVAARPSTRLKQFWFLSRALAGALLGVKTRTAINLVGSLRPEEIFAESRDGKPIRKRTREKFKPRRAR